MAFTLRLKDSEQADLDLIQQRLQCSTSASTIKQIIALWIPLQDSLKSTEQENFDLRDQIVKYELMLHRISQAFSIVKDFSERD